MFRPVLQRLRSKINWAMMGIVVVGFSASAAPASAQWGCGYGHSYGVYHGPSMHYDAVFHGYSHWTPSRGYHSHGHYHYVPHYVPGHIHYYGGHHH